MKVKFVQYCCERPPGFGTLDPGNIQHIPIKYTNNKNNTLLAITKKPALFYSMHMLK